MYRFLTAIFIQPDNAILPALIIPIAIYLLAALYRFYTFVKRTALHYFFDRKRRLKAVLEEFKEHDVPRAEGEFSSLEEYLDEVALNPKTSNKARFYLGALAGATGTLRTYGHYGEFLITVTLEKALEQYAPEIQQETTSEAS